MRKSLLIEPKLSKNAKPVVLKWLAPLSTFLGAVYPLPQMIKIMMGDSQGVSMSAWILMALTSLFWSIYCIENKQYKPGIDNATKTFFRLLVVGALAFNWWFQ